jgi:hypothetical protein
MSLHLLIQAESEASLSLMFIGSTIPRLVYLQLQLMQVFGTHVSIHVCLRCIVLIQHF